MLKKLLAGSALLLGMSTSALAAEMYSFTTGSPTGAGDFAQATEVQTNSAIVIDQIGLWANGGILTENHGFRIRNLTLNVDLFNGIISANTGTLVNGFRYIDIPDIAVAAGVQLAVISDNRSDPNDDLMQFGLADLAFDPAFTLIGSSFQDGVDVSDYPFPLGEDFGVIAGANLLFNVVVPGGTAPEPGTLALLLFGMLGLARSRLTRRI